jgi:o-succinylbenzoate synthase
VMSKLVWETDSGTQIISYGESTTHSEPFYNGEFDETAIDYLNRLIPHVLEQKVFGGPEDLLKLIAKLKFDKQNRFAIAVLDVAFNDAFAQAENKPLNRYLVDHYQYPGDQLLTEIPVGISRGMKNTPEDLALSVMEFVNKGNKKIKLKISPQKDLEYIEAVVDKTRDFDVKIMVDANSSYDEQDKDQFEKIVSIAPLVYMIEQPFSYDDIWHHAQLVNRLIADKISTKICLDESVRCLKDVKNFINQIAMISGKTLQEVNSKVAINIKISRVGGLSEAMAIALYCKQNGIHIMPGGMHEFDIAQAAIVAFSSIDPSFSPGDSEGAETYYCGALTKVEGKRVTTLNTNPRGNLDVPTAMGLGIGEIDFDELTEIKKGVYISSIDVAAGRWSPTWNKNLLEQTKEKCFS